MLNADNIYIFIDESVMAFGPLGFIKSMFCIVSALKMFLQLALQSPRKAL